MIETMCLRGDVPVCRCETCATVGPTLPPRVYFPASDWGTEAAKVAAKEGFK